MDDVVIRYWKKLESCWSSNSSAGGAVRMDGVKASLHFTKLNTQHEGVDTKVSGTEMKDGALVVTIGPMVRF